LRRSRGDPPGPDDREARATAQRKLPELTLIDGEIHIGARLRDRAWMKSARKGRLTDGSEAVAALSFDEPRVPHALEHPTCHVGWQRLLARFGIGTQFELLPGAKGCHLPG